MQTDIGANNSKFYVIQLLVSADPTNTVLFCRWGRVGEVGMMSAHPVATLEEAKTMFARKVPDTHTHTPHAPRGGLLSQSIVTATISTDPPTQFREKTSNEWADRKSFKPRPGKYSIVEKSYDAEPAEPVPVPVPADAPWSSFAASLFGSGPKLGPGFGQPPMVPYTRT